MRKCCYLFGKQPVRTVLQEAFMPKNKQLEVNTRFRYKYLQTDSLVSYSIQCLA